MGPKGKKVAFDQPMLGIVQPHDPDTQSAFRNHMIAASGEFVGTYMFLFFAFLGHLMAVDQAPDFGPDGTNSSTTVMYIATSYGFSLLVTVWGLYRVSGGLFNPAVTVGLVITGNLPAWRGLILLPPQILGAICAAAVVSCIVPGDINTVQTTLAPGVSVAQGVFLEMFLTAGLVFTVLMLAAEKSKDTFIAPIGIGLSLFIAEVAGVYYTGASLNPARSFGPCVAGASFTHYQWIYWIGPLLGALISGGYYHFVKFFNYEAANPGQDSSGGAFDADIEERQSRGSELESQISRGGRGGSRDGPVSRDGAVDRRGRDVELGRGAERDGYGSGSGYHPGYENNRA